MADKKKKRPPAFDQAVRLRVQKEVAREFIDPDERVRRIRSAMEVAGFRSIHTLAMACGMHSGTLHKAIRARAPRITTLQALSVVLRVSMSFLTERTHNSAR